MPKKNPSIEQQTSRLAIGYALRRIGEDENIRYHCGYGTELFERLVQAQAVIIGQTKEQVQSHIFGFKLNRKPCAQTLLEIRDILNGDGGTAMQLSRIKELVL